MGSDTSGRRGWQVPEEQDICHSCGVVAYPGEMFCTACGAYLAWDADKSVPAVPKQPTHADPVRSGPTRPDPAQREPSWPEPAQPDEAHTDVFPSGRIRTDDPLFTQPPTAPAPVTARPEPAHGRTDFVAPAQADLFATTGSGYATGPGGHYEALPGADYPAYVQTASLAPEPAEAQTQVLDAEVVLWTSLPEGHPHAQETEPTSADGASHLLLCPQCREPNAESRTYCHPCGALLRPEPEPEPVVLTRWEKLRQQYVERPEIWHWDRRLGVLLAALPLCLVAGVSMGGATASADQAVPRIKDHFMSQSAVAPDSVSASSSAKGFEANLATDGLDNKAWAPAETDKEAIGESWTAQFQTPFRLTSLAIINGAAKTPKEFFATGRPTKITVTATTTGHGKVKKDITLSDQPGPQRFDLGIDGVTSVQVTIDAVHPGLKPNMPVAMAEIQFFSRQAS
ncbi:NADase-type glycan-binding domain-containing protein [Streptomyces sp. NPDC002537]